MAHSQATISFTGKAGWLASIGLFVAVVAFCLFSVRYQLGTMLGEVSDPQAPNASEIADAAVELSPRDPLTA